ncbi:CBASS cGAMP synthase [Chromobacterium sphagni]|uniref:CBASS cGAMP synthase n=1 Tax=Chromobacterium sphagni TaxID=1903179 RepID=UPI00240972BF|nr:CBASS cGAMP synthase [Chromobacterium sphagni]
MYFDMVEESLRELSRVKGWKLDDQKDTCARVILGNCKAHIDVPLYVIDKAQFKKMAEAIVMAKALGRSAVVADSLSFAEDDFTREQWEDLEAVSLACRNGKWKASDPRHVSRYFEMQFRRPGGDQLKRICRYLKAARDFKYVSGGPSSIVLMLCATKFWRHIDGRDDLALNHVLLNVKALLKGSVYCSEISDEDFNRLPEHERQEASNWLSGLYRSLSIALETGEPNGIAAMLKMLRKELDQRIPIDTSLVVLGEALTPAQVREFPAQTQPQPPHRNVTSG